MCEQVHVTLIEIIVVAASVALTKIKTNAAQLRRQSQKPQSNSKSSFCFLFKFNER